MHSIVLMQLKFQGSGPDSIRGSFWTTVFGENGLVKNRFIVKMEYEFKCLPQRKWGTWSYGYQFFIQNHI